MSDLLEFDLSDRNFKLNETDDVSSANRLVKAVTQRTADRTAASVNSNLWVDDSRSDFLPASKAAAVSSNWSEATPHADINFDVSRSLNVPKIEVSSKTPQARTKIIQDWKGYVVDVGESDVTVRLQDMTTHDSVESEEADFPIDEFLDDNRDVVRPGALFRWVIGYERTGNRGRRHFSEIYFRKFPDLSDSIQDDVEKRTAKFMAAVSE